MIINCIADLHGHYPKLEGGDLLIVAGDLTRNDTRYQHFEVCEWMNLQDYKKKVFIAGNHDGNLCNELVESWPYPDQPTLVYLCDSGTEFEGLKIWGSPWTLKFPGMNPRCMAFTCNTEEELAEKWELIPDDIDILVTHGPPKHILDKTTRGNAAGSSSLLKRICELTSNNLRLIVFGHIHEAYGHNVTLLPYEFPEMRCVNTINCSHVNERYQPVNKPIRIIL